MLLVEPLPTLVRRRRGMHSAVGVVGSADPRVAMQYKGTEVISRSFCMLIFTYLVTILVLNTDRPAIIRSSKMVADPARVRMKAQDQALSSAPTARCIEKVISICDRYNLHAAQTPEWPPHLYSCHHKNMLQGWYVHLYRVSF